ncbi:hypothetical protein C0J52_20599 [Blattella germanica]|nr:hypothetical protein C0J52_20599 [Blattella germanica]
MTKNFCSIQNTIILLEISDQPIKFNYQTSLVLLFFLNLTHSLPHPTMVGFDFTCDYYRIRLWSDLKSRQLFVYKKYIGRSN